MEGSRLADGSSRLFMCLVCKDTLTLPVVMSCCGQSICITCIKSVLHLSDDKLCPKCSEPGRYIINRVWRSYILRKIKESNEQSDIMDLSNASFSSTDVSTISSVSEQSSSSQEEEYPCLDELLGVEDDDHDIFSESTFQQEHWDEELFGGDEDNEVFRTSSPCQQQMEEDSDSDQDDIFSTSSFIQYQKEFQEDISSSPSPQKHHDDHLTTMEDLISHFQRMRL